MENEEILYDDIAMENVHSLLINANNKLLCAKEYYKSDKLSGNSLINEVESFANDVVAAINRANLLLSEINEGNGSNEELQVAGEIISSDTGKMLNGVNTDVQDSGDTFELTEEWIEKYESDLEDDLSNCDEVIDLFGKDISEKEKILSDFLHDSSDYADDTLYVWGEPWGQYGGRYLTPEEYREWLEANYVITLEECYDENGVYSEEIFLAKIAERDKLVEEYEAKFDKLFLEKTGMTYTEFSKELNSSKEIVASAKTQKYALKQQLKEVPYLRIMITEEYKNFGFDTYGNWSSSPNGDELWYIVLCRNGYSDLFYEEDGKIKSYLHEDEEKMLFYNIIMRNKESNGGTEYLEAIQDRINQRMGERAAKQVYDSCLNSNGEVDLNAFTAIAFATDGFGDGINLFFEGIGNVFQNNDVMSAMQYKQSYLLQYLLEDESLSADALSFVYQNGSTVGNMAIPIAVSTVVSMMTGGAGAGIVGTTLMGFSAGGNAKHQALVDGNSVGAAWLYGICSGLSESALGYFLGKIPGLSKLSGLTLGNLFSEGFEEFSQEFVDAGLRAIIFGEEIDLAEVSDNAMKSFIMGAIVAAEFNGATTLAVKYKGKHVEISFNDVIKYCEKHPELNVAELLIDMVADNATIEEYRGMKDKEYDVFGIDQGILSKIFGGNFSITQDAKNVAKDVINVNEDVLKNFIMKELKWSSTDADNGVINLKDIVSKPDTTSLANFTKNFLNDFFTYMRESGKIDLETENRFKNGVIEPTKQGDDILRIKQNILDHMEKQGMLPEETVRVFSSYDRETGGICSFAAFANAICQQLSEEKFLKHFGFEKYVTINGKKVYNPLLLTDIVFCTAREGAVSKPNFVQENGHWRLKDGKLNGVTLGRDILVFDTELANTYLSLKGLEVTELTKQARKPYPFSDIMEFSGVPEEGPIISEDYLNFILDTANKEGASVILSIGGREGVSLRDVDNGDVIDFKDSNHAVTVFGRNEDGIDVSSYGREMILKYEDIKSYTYKDYLLGDLINATVGYSVIKISEIGE